LEISSFKVEYLSIFAKLYADDIFQIYLLLFPMLELALISYYPFVSRLDAAACVTAEKAIIHDTCQV
jgi:hypothetical protein